MDEANEDSNKIVFRRFFRTGQPILQLIKMI
jgi:hypothetical protein